MMEGTDTTSASDTLMLTSVEDSKFNCTEVVKNAVVMPTVLWENDNTGSMTPVGDVPM